MKTLFNYAGIRIYFIFLILLFLSITTNAQIIYTDVIPDTILINNGDVFHLDLNHDGIIDFNLNQTKSTVTGGSFCAGSRTKHGVTVSPVNTLNAVANTFYSGVNYATPIGADTIINDTSFIWQNGSAQNLANITWVCSGMKTHRLWHSTITGKWNGAIDKFLGLRFQLGGNTYFGWVRLTIGGSSFTVKDFAYNSVPDQLIYSGQSTTEFLTTSQISGSPFCVSDTLSVGFTVYGNFDSTNVFSAQLSDSSGSFSNPIVIGSLPGNTSGTIHATIPQGAIYSYLYRIRVLASNPIGVSNFNNSNLIINNSLPLNHITTFDTTTCRGDSSYIYAPSQTGYSYQWSLDTINIDGATRYYFYGNSEGSYRCMITNGCGSVQSDSISLNFIPSPIATIHSTGALWVCPGESVGLFTDSLVGLTYTWFRNNSIVGYLSQYHAVYAGSYYVRATDSLGCSGTSENDSVVISNPLSNIVAGGPVLFCSGDSVLLSLTSQVDTSFTFQWYRFNNVIPGAWYPTYYAKLSGSYSLIVTNSYGNCDSISNAIDVVTVCAGIETTQSANTHFILGPNPSNNFLEIKRQTEKPATIQIINHLGQIVYFEKINSSQKLIDVNNFSPGVYFIKWIEEDYSESKQFSVMN